MTAAPGGEVREGGERPLELPPRTPLSATAAWNANNQEFELAADIRDRIRELRQEFDLHGGEDEEGVPAPTDEF